jgi:hypothetical protein
MASSGAVFDHSNDEAIMPKANESFQLAATAEQIAKQTQEVMENYFGWLQKTVSALPWSNTNLNRILLSQATQNVTATFAFVQKLSQAKNFQDVVKIQTEFMETQMNSFNEQAKILGEIYTKAAAETMKAPSLSPRE